LLTHPTLESLPRIAHAFFTREGGTSEGIYASLNCGPGSNDAPDRVAENRARAMAMLELPANALATARQVHGKNVCVVTRPWKASAAPEADALVTNVPGLAIGILTADCAPVLLADPDGGVVGAAHAGWRGAKAGVLEAVLDAMVALGADRARIRAAVGPCIGQASYEVGPEFPAPFLAESAKHARFFQEGATGRLHFDLGAYVAERLSAAGVAKPACVPADTFRDPARFFSYRRTCMESAPDYGRTLSAIAIRNGA